MRRALCLVGLLMALVQTSWAGASSHFTMGGDRVLINLDPGHPGSADDDTNRLYEALKVNEGSTLIGRRQTKKLQWKSAMTMALSKNQAGRVDGTLMIYRWPGVRIDTSRRTVTIHWTGSAAVSLFKKFKATNGNYEFVSYDERLKIRSSETQFDLFFSEF